MKMKKLLKNAVVYAVAASMLVATPLTASAGLIDAYSISDGSDKKPGDEGYESHTGTVTSTDTNTSVLGENDAKIIGIALDQYTVDTEVGKTETLNATVIFDGEVSDDVIKQISNKITWKVTRLDENGEHTTEPNKYGALNETLSITAHAEDRSVVTLNPRKGTTDGNVFVTASIGGDKEYDYKYIDENGVEQTKLYKTTELFEKSAEVSIKEYAGRLELVGYPGKQYVKHTYDMNEYLVKYNSLGEKSDTVNDTVTWTITNQDGKSISTAAISAAGVVTIKKVDTKKVENNKIRVTAVSEKGKKAVADFDIDKGEKAEKVIITEHDEIITKRTIDVGGPAETSEDDFVVRAEMVYKKKNADGGYDVQSGTTDEITWSSNKTSIVKVEANEQEATLIPQAVGKAVITAKASNGASAKLTVTVKATLNDLEITNTETSLYSGQTLQLDHKKTPTISKDAVKWTIQQVPKDATKLEGLSTPDQIDDLLKNLPKKDKIANPNASINSKGVLTIKPKVDSKYPIVVQLSSKSKVVTGYIRNDNDEITGTVKEYIVADPITINVEQSTITSIKVTDDVTKGVVAKIDVVNGGKSVKKDANAVNQKSTVLYVPKGRSFTAAVAESDEYGAETLTWSTSSAKVATVERNDEGAVITTHAYGKATITVSGVYETNKKGTYKALKTTFKVDVKQPATSLKLNNTLVVKNVNEKKAQTVQFKATQGPKGAKETVTWTATVNGVAYPNIKSGKLTIPKGGKVGDVYTVTAKTTTGMSATATVKILKKTTSVAIHDAPKGNIFIDTSGKKPANNTTRIGLGGDGFKMYPEINIGKSTKAADLEFVTPGEDDTETITYSVNKKGIVSISADGTVIGLKPGTVTITAKTPTGKKATLKVIVENK